MKKLNKKGFTLAELLIVIAIIAILIAIAIPAFSASLYSARLQTDHANIRAAYAVARTAEMLGVIDDETNESTTAVRTTPYVFNKDGKVVASTTGDPNAYKLQTKSNKADDCASSVICSWSGTNTNHQKDNKIYIAVQDGHWTVVLATSAPTPTEPTP